ncbi:MAG: hypothetical protein ACOYNI_07640 [Acidimicrobiia bacterium]
MSNEEFDTASWLDDMSRRSGFDVVSGSAADRRAELDHVVHDAQHAGLPVIRLDGKQSHDWAAQLHLSLGPFSLGLSVQSNPNPATADPRSPSAPSPSHSPSHSAPGTPSTLPSAIDELAQVALTHGGAVLAVDDLHRVPAEVRDALMKAVHDSGAPILVVGTSVPSHAPRLEHAGAVLNETPTQGVAHDTPATTNPDRTVNRPPSAARHASLDGVGTGPSLARSA